MEHLKDFLGGYNRTWSDLGLVPGFSIIHEERINKSNFTWYMFTSAPIYV